MDRDSLRNAYEGRRPLLEEAKDSIFLETQEALMGLSHIDRVYFRVKGTESFLEKALAPDNSPPYQYALAEIEDQIAGRIIVFFLSDFEKVQERLAGTFSSVERKHSRPSKDEEFGYESYHMICTIPPHLKPAGWNELVDPPNTFEIQIRTIFMHAYSEPQHDIGYKGSKDLPGDIRRELAWIAASAWGADRAYQRVAEWNMKEVVQTDPK